MDKGPFSKAAAQNALDRLIDVARSDTGQSRRVANFLLAWWNGEDCGHCPLADLFGVDATIATHITTIVGFLGQHEGAIYTDAFGCKAEMIELVGRWRDFGDSRFSNEQRNPLVIKLLLFSGPGRTRVATRHGFNWHISACKRLYVHRAYQQL